MFLNPLETEEMRAEVSELRHNINQPSRAKEVINKIIFGDDKHFYN